MLAGCYQSGLSVQLLLLPGGQGLQFTSGRLASHFLTRLLRRFVCSLTHTQKKNALFQWTNCGAELLLPGMLNLLKGQTDRQNIQYMLIKKTRRTYHRILVTQQQQQPHRRQLSRKIVFERKAFAVEKYIRTMCGYPLSDSLCEGGKKKRRGRRKKKTSVTARL